eukprot:scaffold11091_cov92-Amphora_coffeaeformis.AAC.1
MRVVLLAVVTRNLLLLSQQYCSSGGGGASIPQTQNFDNIDCTRAFGKKKSANPDCPRSARPYFFFVECT